MELALVSGSLNDLSAKSLRALFKLRAFRHFSVRMDQIAELKVAAFVSELANILNTEPHILDCVETIEVVVGQSDKSDSLSQQIDYLSTLISSNKLPTRLTWKIDEKYVYDMIQYISDEFEYDSPMYATLFP